MKLKPPKVEIDPENPFEPDLFGRKPFATSLTNLLKNIEDNLVLFVTAPWGDGKTIFARQWIASLTNQGSPAIYFDAYASDYMEDPFIAFSGEILSFVKSESKAIGVTKTKANKFKQAAGKVGSTLADLAGKKFAGALTCNLVTSDDVDGVKTLLKDVRKSFRNDSSALVEKQIEEAADEKKLVEDFQKTLTAIASAVRDKTGFPLTIVVDELDRCNPEFALRLLERIKHLFGVENVAFILFVNLPQIQNYVSTQYGSKIDARNYLHKFADVTVELPDKSRKNRVSDYDVYCNHLLHHHGLDKGVKREALQVTTIGLSAHFELSFREIERLMSHLTLYFASRPNEGDFLVYLVVLLAIIKMKNQAAYNALSKGTMGFAEFEDLFRLASYEESHNRLSKDTLINALRHCLLSDEEFNALPEEQRPRPIVRLWHKDRRAHIPLLCSFIDSFALEKPLEASE